MIQLLYSRSNFFIMLFLSGGAQECRWVKELLPDFEVPTWIHLNNILNTYNYKFFMPFHFYFPFDEMEILSCSNFRSLF